MNVNVILDTDYICSQLSNNESSIRVANLFMLLKHKSNIIILQDNDQSILKNILHQLQYNFENIENSDLDHASIFITELAKGTDNFTFVTEEKYEDKTSVYLRGNTQLKTRFGISYGNEKPLLSNSEAKVLMVAWPSLTASFINKEKKHGFQFPLIEWYEGMGHSKIQTTQSHYGHILDENVSEQMRKIEDRIKS